MIQSPPNGTPVKFNDLIFEGGEMGALIREKKWADTPLGPIETWPQSLRTTVNIILQSPVPIVMLWGPDGIMLYNDAYSVFAGGRHPFLLGSKVLEGWPEVADFNRNVMEQGLKGRTLSFKDQQLTLYRNNVAEEVWMDLNYSPIPDESNKPAGVMAIVVETTQRILAEQKQKQAEENLLTERERLYQLFIQAPALIAILRGKEGFCELFNTSLAKLWKNRDVIGKPMREAWPELQGQGWFEIAEEVYSTGETVHVNEMPALIDWENSGTRKEHFFNFVITPFLSSKGKVDGIMLFGFHVTGQVLLRRKMEEMNKAVEKERERLFSIFMQAPNPVVVLRGHNHVIELANDHTLEIWKRRREEVINLPVIEALPELKGQGLIEMLDLAYRSGTTQRGFEQMIKLNYGNGKLEDVYFTFVYEPIRGSDGLVEGVLVVAFVVTEQVMARKKVEESEQRWRVMAEALPQKIFTTTPAGDAAYYNPQWEAFSGLPVEQLKVREWTKLIHPDDLEETVARWQASLDTGRLFQIEHRFKRKDGEYRWHLTRAIPMRGSDGVVSMWVGSSTDIHDQKIALEKKDEFLSIASHELKTPLTSVKASLQIISQLLQEKNFGEMKRFVEKGEVHVNKLTGLVGDLLDISRMHAGKLQFNVSEFAAYEVIDECVEQIKHQVKKHVIIAEVDHSIRLVADKARLEQVVSNLLANAVKYSPNADKVILKAINDNGNLKVSVTDFGIGIAEEKQQLIFERFYRAQETAHQFQGLGLGLYIANEIIKRHHGSMWVESTEGAGSTFHFMLPLNGEAIGQSLPAS